MFVGLSDDELRIKFLGLSDHIEEQRFIDDSATSGLPASFNWQTQKPECVGAVRSQLNCGSCWAFSSTSTLADRACIKTGQTGIVLSPEDMVLCDTNNHGCNGGSL